MKTVKYISAIVLLSLGIGIAATSFNFNSGTGFVPEADIRVAYNWQSFTPKRLTSLSFSVYFRDVYACVCSTPGGNFNQNRQVRGYRQLYQSPVYVNNQLTGFSLNGYSYMASDQVPYIGQNCNYSQWYGTFSSVTLSTHSAQLYMTTSASTTQPSSQLIWQE